MGRIKSLLVKRTSRKLVEDESIPFTDKFEDNKKILRDTMPSKPIRNKIAGYMARIIRMKNKKLAEANKPKPSVQEAEPAQSDLY